MNVLEIVEILEEQGFSNKKAIKLAEAINGKSGLATKEDLHKVENRMGRLETSNKWVIVVLFLILSLLVKVAFF